MGSRVKHHGERMGSRGDMERIPDAVRTKLADLLYLAQMDPHAEVELRVGKLDEHGHFHTDLGARTLDHIASRLRTNPHWKHEEETHTVDTFYEGEPVRLSMDQTNQRFTCVRKQVRDRVDVPLVDLPFDFRVSWTSEIPSSVPDAPVRYTREKRRQRFNDRDLFAYDLTRVETSTYATVYEAEIEMLAVAAYVGERGPLTAAESLLLKGLDIVHLFTL